MQKEKDLYEPIRKALLDCFKPKGFCELWVTAEAIPNEVQSFLNRDALMIMQREKSRPDIMGYIQESLPFPVHSKRIIIIEVKIGPPKVKSIYQAKMYADIFSAYYTFLITRKRLDAVRAKFLQDHDFMLKFGKENNRIGIMYFLNNNILEFDKRLNFLNPFDTSIF